MSGLCKDCKHWRSWETDDYRTGLCYAISDRDDEAIGPGYGGAAAKGASLETHESFGCVLHEARE